MFNIKKMNRWQLFLVFLILASVCMLPQLAKQTMYMNSWDVPFHLSRMYELEKGFEVGKWFPDISAYTFGENGYGVNLFYGYSFTYFVAVIYFFTQQAVTAVLIGYVVLLTSVMAVNFYAGTLFFTGTNTRLKSFAFSVLYVLAPVTFGEINVRGLPGELIGILLFPAVLAGFYGIMFTNRKNYVLTSILSAVIVTNHVLSAFLLVIILVVMVFIFFFQKEVTLAKIVRLIKVGLLTILLSAFYVIPFLQHLLTDKIAGANKMWGTVSPWESIAASVNNQATLNWTAIPVGLFVFIMSIIISVELLHFRTLSKQVRTIGCWLVISLVTVFYMPTEFFAKTPLHVFQMMGRFYPLIMLLSLLFVIEGLDHFYEIGVLHLKTMNWIFIAGIMLSLFSAWKMQGDAYYSAKVPIANYQKGGKAFPKTVGNNDFEYQINHYYQLPLGSKDYLGQKRVKFVSGYQVASWGDTRDATRIYIDNQLSSLRLFHKGYTFEVKNIPESAKQILLPMTNYQGWQATDGAGKSLLIKTVKGKLAVEPKGSQVIQLTYHKTVLHQVAIIISAMTMVILVFVSIFIILKNKKRA